MHRKHHTLHANPGSERREGVGHLLGHPDVNKCKVFTNLFVYSVITINYYCNSFLFALSTERTLRFSHGEVCLPSASAFVYESESSDENKPWVIKL